MHPGPLKLVSDLVEITFDMITLVFPSPLMTTVKMAL